MACLWNFFLVLFQDCLSEPVSWCFCWTFLQLASLVLSLDLILGLSLDCVPCAFLGLILGAFYILFLWPVFWFVSRPFSCFLCLGHSLNISVGQPLDVLSGLCCPSLSPASLSCRFCVCFSFLSLHTSFDYSSGRVFWLFLWASLLCFSLGISLDVFVGPLSGFVAWPSSNEPNERNYWGYWGYRGVFSSLSFYFSLYTFACTPLSCFLCACVWVCETFRFV